jgi:hypothetical protein
MELCDVLVKCYLKEKENTVYTNRKQKEEEIKGLMSWCTGLHSYFIRRRPRV